MLCWGGSARGQLGLGVSEAAVFEPRSCSVFDGRGLKEVACGAQHSIFLMHDGSVYTCGSNSHGQLGHEKSGAKPELVGALDAQKIASVACGQAHSLALSEKGQVFAWGGGEGGQLGLGTVEEAVRVPRLIKKLCEHRISQVMCGNQHCIALSKDGQLFTWGQNSSGQLGLGKGEPNSLSPQPLKSLSGIPLAQISAGGDHSFALSLSGAVFAWGRNSAGQLGLNDEEDRAVPCHIKFLRSQKVVYISCGEEHTAALTKDGGLFTFGNGSRGQLGHDSINNEPLPRRVLELMGTEVSQIACGRNHTLAFVPSTGLLYAFGCNAQGQLGLGTRGNVKIPMPVRNIFPRYLDTKQPGVSRIHCGGDQSFLVLSHDKCCPEDFRIINTSRSISLINKESLNSWRMKLVDNADSSITNDIILLLSSTACWNASFLDQSVLSGTRYKRCKCMRNNGSLEGIALGFQLLGCGLESQLFHAARVCHLTLSVLWLTRLSDPSFQTSWKKNFMVLYTCMCVYMTNKDITGVAREQPFLNMSTKMLLSCWHST
ncbi:probable E3 ubiquitin-protein ligase HERC3 isoform X3 [Trichomycterus rosablanca]|uniref:probable E3 ubiquitin-protein ligase HERC3 isoform X3 n=1 Tax=Trichomycterus rosablanca TaxID=2290929 RepID=UPI002F36014D